MENDSVRSSLIKLQSFPQRQNDVDPIHSVLMSPPCFVHVLCKTRCSLCRSQQSLTLFVTFHNGLPRSIATFVTVHNGLPLFYRTLTTTDQQTSLLAGSDRLVLCMRLRASDRLRHHRDRRLRGNRCSGNRCSVTDS